jgi:hypothetical protein
MSAATIIPSLIPLIVVVAMRRAEERIHRQLTDARALTAETAIPLAPSRGIERRRLQGLIHGGAIRLTADGRHFLDADGWAKYRSNRRRRALIALSVVLALVGIGLAVLFSLR